MGGRLGRRKKRKHNDPQDTDKQEHRLLVTPGCLAQSMRAATRTPFCHADCVLCYIASIDHSKWYTKTSVRPILSSNGDVIVDTRRQGPLAPAYLQLITPWDDTSPEGVDLFERVWRDQQAHSAQMQRSW